MLRPLFENLRLGPNNFSHTTPSYNYHLTVTQLTPCALFTETCTQIFTVTILH